MQNNIVARLVFALTLTFFAGAVACDDDLEAISGDGGQLGDGSSLFDGLVVVDFPPVKPCPTACVSPQYCSKAGTCIAAGTCAHPLDCQPPLTCDMTTKKCVIPGSCGAKKVTAGMAPPNLLIVCDRSPSMMSLVGGVSKWQIAVTAISKLLTTYQVKIRFGLTLFPDTTGSDCTQGTIPIGVAAGNETKIKALLTASLSSSDPYYPDGPYVTNIDTAMKQAAAHTPLFDTTRSSFVLLLTDGQQQVCNSGGGDSGTLATITDLYKNKKVATFVVGFGNGVDPNQLNIFAAAGGKPASTTGTKYYKAEDQAGLDKALAAIAKATFGCVMKLGTLPTGLDQVFVFFDQKLIAQDTTHTNGWDLDTTTGTLTFYGQPCTDLLAGKINALDIIYACKSAVGDGGFIFGDGGTKCPSGTTPCQTTANCPQHSVCVSGCCMNVPS